MFFCYCFIFEHFGVVKLTHPSYSLLQEHTKWKIDVASGLLWEKFKLTLLIFSCYLMFSITSNAFQHLYITYGRNVILNQVFCNFDTHSPWAPLKPLGPLAPDDNTTKWNLIETIAGHQWHGLLNLSCPMNKQEWIKSTVQRSCPVEAPPATKKSESLD